MEEIFRGWNRLNCHVNSSVDVTSSLSLSHFSHSLSVLSFSLSVVRILVGVLNFPSITLSILCELWIPLGYLYVNHINNLIWRQPNTQTIWFSSSHGITLLTVYLRLLCLHFNFPFLSFSPAVAIRSVSFLLSLNFLPKKKKKKHWNWYKQSQVNMRAGKAFDSIK